MTDRLAAVHEPFEDEPETEILPADSLAGRIAERRRDLERKTTEDFDVPGYEGILVARYKVVGYAANRKIGKRHESMPAWIKAELYTMADTLILANVDLLENGGDDPAGHRPLGLRWGVKAAQDLFRCQLPDNATARQAMFAIFPDDMKLMRHYGDVSQWILGNNPRIDDDLAADLGKETVS